MSKILTVSFEDDVAGVEIREKRIISGEQFDAFRTPGLAVTTVYAGLVQRVTRKVTDE